MAIALEFIDFIVPISVIRAKYPSGWQKYLDDHRHLIGGRVWYDEHLLRDGAMNPSDIESLVEEWAALGFQLTEEIDGQKVGRDACVVESMFGGTTLPCEWLGIDAKRRCAYLNGQEPGKIIGCDNFSSSDT